MRKWILTGFAVVIVIGILIGYFYIWQDNSGIAGSMIDYQIDATSLFDEFTKDEQEASRKYLNKIILVKGTVSQYIENENQSQLIILKTNDELYGINCSIDPKNEIQTKFRPGDTLVIKGKLLGIMGDILLGNCLIIN
jgi:hypothetical protein